MCAVAMEGPLDAENLYVSCVAVALVNLRFTQTQSHFEYQQLASDIFKELIEIRSTESGRSRGFQPY